MTQREQPELAATAAGPSPGATTAAEALTRVSASSNTCHAMDKKLDSQLDLLSIETLTAAGWARVWYTTQ